MKRHNNVVAIATQAPARNPNPTLKQLVEETSCFISECRRLADEGVDLAERCKQQNVPLSHLPHAVKVLIAEQKAENTTVKLDGIEIPVWIYGFLSNAAVIHGHKDWKETLVEYLACTVTEWAGEQGYFLE